MQVNKLSFKKSSSPNGPIAIIKGGENKGKLVYISNEDTEDDEIPAIDLINSLGTDYFYDLYSEIKDGKGRKYKKKRGFETEDLIELIKALSKKDKSLLKGNTLLEKMYDKSIEDAKENLDGKELTVESPSHIELLPPTIIKGERKGHSTYKPTRTCIFITGPSGSGKSTQTAVYAKNFLKLFPGCPVYLFSELEEDKVLDSIKGLKRIKVGENLIEETINPEDLSGKIEGKPTSLVIFDDIDVIKNKQVKNEVYKIQDSLLQIGRHSEIYVVCTGHVMLNYVKTRILLTECPFVTFFPRAGATWQIERFLKHYLGAKPQQIKRILSLPSRWVTVYKNYPQYVIYEHGIFLLGSK